jgi:hypothetical protein
MHAKRHKFSTNSEISIVQRSYEWSQSTWVIENHEKWKQISSDQWNLNYDKFFQKQTSSSR